MREREQERLISYFSQRETSDAGYSSFDRYPLIKTQAFPLSLSLSARPPGYQSDVCYARRAERNSFPCAVNARLDVLFSVPSRGQSLPGGARRREETLADTAHADARSVRRFENELAIQLEQCARESEGRSFQVNDALRTPRTLFIAGPPRLLSWLRMRTERDTHTAR